MEQMERIKEVFQDDIEYIDSNAYYSGEALHGRNKVKFQFQGIDYNYPDVQKINIIYGRNLNEGRCQEPQEKCGSGIQRAMELFGTENAVGKTFRTTVYGETDDYNVVGVYKKGADSDRGHDDGNRSDQGSIYSVYDSDMAQRLSVPGESLRQGRNGYEGI